MWIYLVDAEQLQDEKTGAELSERAYRLMDGCRRLKAGKCKSPGVRGTALAAGLAMQLAAIGFNGGKAVTGDDRDDPVKGYNCENLISLTAEAAVRVLENKGEVVDLAYSNGENGKPYLKQEQVIPAYVGAIPFFSISHSGKYAVVAISDRETGIDIQKRKKIDTTKLSSRFFTERESDMICSDPGLFFTFWTRKEAWGKCEGCGLGPALLKDFSDISGEMSASYKWSEYELPDGYALCVCEKIP